MTSSDSGDTWKAVHTIRGKDDVQRVAVDVRTRTVYAGTASGEVRRSTSGGKRWRRTGTVVEGEPVLELVADPRTHLVWAGTAKGIFKSADRGVTWSQSNNIGARELAIDPTKPGTIFAAHHSVFRTTDDGATWRGVGNARYALSLMIDPRTTPSTVYVGTSYESVMKIADGGDIWKPAREGLPRLGEVIDMAIDVRTDPSTLYAATSGLGVNWSTDGGKTWHPGE
jgi:photosystem II stability/assembly factor-like uncharacterized protein